MRGDVPGGGLCGEYASFSTVREITNGIAGQRVVTRFCKTVTETEVVDLEVNNKQARSKLWEHSFG